MSYSELLVVRQSFHLVNNKGETKGFGKMRVDGIESSALERHIIKQGTMLCDYQENNCLAGTASFQDLYLRKYQDQEEIAKSYVHPGEFISHSDVYVETASIAKMKHGKPHVMDNASPVEGAPGLLGNYSISLYKRDQLVGSVPEMGTFCVTGPSGFPNLFLDKGNTTNIMPDHPLGPSAQFSYPQEVEAFPGENATCWNKLDKCQNPVPQNDLAFSAKKNITANVQLENIQGDQTMFPKFQDLPAHSICPRENSLDHAKQDTLILKCKKHNEMSPKTPLYKTETPLYKTEELPSNKIISCIKPCEAMGFMSEGGIDCSTELYSEFEYKVICTSDLLLLNPYKKRPRLLPTGTKMYMTIFPNPVIEPFDQENKCSFQLPKPHNQYSLGKNNLAECEDFSNSQSFYCNMTTLPKRKTHQRPGISVIRKAILPPKKQYLKRYLLHQLLQLFEKEIHTMTMTDLADISKVEALHSAMAPLIRWKSFGPHSFSEMKERNLAQTYPKKNHLHRYLKSQQCV